MTVLTVGPQLQWQLKTSPKPGLQELTLRLQSPPTTRPSRSQGRGCPSPQGPPTPERIVFKCLLFARDDVQCKVPASQKEVGKLQSSRRSSDCTHTRSLRLHSHSPDGGNGTDTRRPINKHQLTAQMPAVAPSLGPLGPHQPAHRTDLGDEDGADFGVVLEILQNLHPFSLGRRAIDVGSREEQGRISKPADALPSHPGAH